MNDKERESAERIMIGVSQGCIPALEEKLRKQFSDAALEFTSQAFPGSVSIKIQVSKEYANVAALIKACDDLEEMVGYPELHFVVRQI